MTIRYLIALTLGFLNMGFAIVDQHEFRATATFLLGQFFIIPGFALLLLAKEARPFTCFGGR